MYTETIPTANTRGAGSGASALQQSILVDYNTTNNANALLNQINFNQLANISQLSTNESGAIYNHRYNQLADEHLETIQFLADTGYLLSLISLIFAMLILTCVKRLRCPKNNLHLQLFISFIIRSAGHELEYSQYTTGLKTSTDLYNLWVCKAITIIWQYSLLANYNWILMEGVYLHSLIFTSAMSPYGPSIIGYIIFGWAMPLIFEIPWIVAKINYEDAQCWLTNANQGYFWILRAPITLSILINFVIYIKIVNTLYSKIFSGKMVLQASKRNNDNNYRKLLRSTLVLIPLFGVHYFALLILHQWAEISKSELVEVIWLYIEQVLTACQGFIVACLYCFLNGEVHQELKRLWRRVKS